MESAAEGQSAEQRIDIRGIPATTHLFFDDKIEHVENVNVAITQHNREQDTVPIDLVSIHCVVSGGVDLVNAGDMKIRVNTFKEYCDQKTRLSAGPHLIFLIIVMLYTCQQTKKQGLTFHYLHRGLV